MAEPSVHLILCTHTTLHLRRCLLGCAHQSRRAESLRVSCDVVSEEILDVVRSACDEFSLDMTVIQRAHTGKARCSQVRNNAVRSLLAEMPAVSPEARLVFLDGDTCPAHNALEQHVRLGGADRLVSTYRVNLSPEQTERFSEDAVRDGRAPIELTAAQRSELNARQSRYERQAFWRGVRLGKEHKPRLIGGHFSVPLSAYMSVNGCDEMYEGYGQEDDDLARRMFRAGFRTRVGVREIVVYHQFHPTRAPGDWHAAPGVVRFRQRTPTRAERGVVNPVEQGEVAVYRFRPGVRAERVDLPVFTTPRLPAPNMPPPNMPPPNMPPPNMSAASTR